MLSQYLGKNGTFYGGRKKEKMLKSFKNGEKFGKENVWLDTLGLEHGKFDQKILKLFVLVKKINGFGETKKIYFFYEI